MSEQFADCQDCSGRLWLGHYDPIRVPLVDGEGFPILEADGSVQYVTLKLPAHQADTTFARLVFDPTGFAPSPCAHGLKEHPTGITHPWVVSWIRAKYLDVGPGGVKCPVCRGEPQPEDMLVARNN